MLVCLQCQFENPNSNKFCQNCGTSLTDKFCPECGAKVSFSAQHCQNCGTATGQVWWAVVSWEPQSQPPQTSEPEITIPSTDNAYVQIQQLQDIFIGVGSSESSLEPASDIISTELSPALQPPETAVLSPQFPPDDSISNEELEDTGSVNIPGATSFPENENAAFIDKLEQNAIPALDFPKGDKPESGDSETQRLGDSENGEDLTSPSSPSPPSPPSLPAGDYLDTQKRYQLLEPLVLTTTEVTAAAPVLDCNPLQASVLKALLAAKSEIPAMPSARRIAIAQSYLTLQSEFPQNLPQLHDTLQENGQAVMLLENCSNLPLLSAQWSNPETSTQQILYWLNEITELWAALEPSQNRQSLLEMTNLRVNPNPTGSLASIRLQQLYPETAPSSLTLQTLGEFWQALFSQSQRTLFSALAALLRDLHQGDIQTIELLRSRLETMHSSLQPEPTPTSALTHLQLGKFQQQLADAGDDTTTLPLPMQVYRLEDCGRTDVGRQRDHNEDFFSIWTQAHKLETSLGRIFQVKGLYILCDGMGGHSSGEVASQLAVESLKQYFQSRWGDELPSAQTITEAVLLANQAIYEVNQKDVRSGSARMGTTLITVLIQDSQVAVAHVGDSRLYRLRRGGTLKKITTDHEVGQREINRGVDPQTAYSRPDAYQLTQALGPRDDNFVKPEVQFIELLEDTLLILASDGLTDNNFLETHWQSKLEPLLNPQSNLEQGVKELIDLANQHNGHDNITAIVIRAQVRPYRF
ncbi:serine/threonine phosphatase [Kamptonema sp. UHCC 0994]|uniref:serine/threonine phosphatase n=1 Tax=Kamptonema sp. UHCC 0994 TaxID=3031329 RepID=UPI0023B9595B|nr:serine/threonine phosphatase [Kamptonema sp. UHCC 0994]MDF0551986.1 serine/threonine phosphatase [Kamptonema sp. UHCC 0994]